MSRVPRSSDRPLITRRLRRLTARSSRAGFTILEVLVALGILLFGMTAVIGLLTFGVALGRSAELRTEAASVAEAVVADLEEVYFIADEFAGAGGATTLGADPAPIANRELGGANHIVYSAQGRPNPERPLEWRIDIELAWKSAGVQREKRFTTLLLREVPFGERLRRRFVEGERASSAAPSAPTSSTPTTTTTTAAGTADGASAPKK